LEEQETYWVRLFPGVDLTTSRLVFRTLHAALQGLAVQRVFVGSTGERATHALLARMLARELVSA
jgi:hypothetical protein